MVYNTIHYSACSKVFKKNRSIYEENLQIQHSLLYAPSISPFSPSLPPSLPLSLSLVPPLPPPPPPPAQAPIRDHMLAQFTKQPTSISRDPEQLDRCKCSLISAYTSSLHLAFSVHSLRIQTIRYYQNLSYILDSFPATREAHFILGETKNQDSGTKYNFGMPYAGMDPAGRLLAADMHKSKPHQLLSRDGKVLLNLFYLPHYTEV